MTCSKQLEQRTSFTVSKVVAVRVSSVWRLYHPLADDPAERRPPPTSRAKPPSKT